MRVPLLLAAALALAGAPDRPRFAPDRAPPALRPAVARAERAIRAAACDVEERFGEGEPPDASATGCADAAAAAAAPDMAGLPGATVGRTSARLRNPANAPPACARAYVAETDGRRAADVAPVVFGLGDRVGLLRPIAIRERCLRCHAPAAKLSASTRAWLSRAYPKDRALGYALGDLRGFWWAEAPLH